MRFSYTDNQKSPIQVLCYGESGSGKTELCGTLTNQIIISHEKGLLTLADQKIPVIEVECVADVLEALTFVRDSADAQQFKTICIDSLSDIAEGMLMEYKKQTTSAPQAYGQMADSIIDLIRGFRKLEDKNIFVTCKIGVLLDTYSNTTTLGPRLPGKSASLDLAYMFDEVFALRINQDGETQTRYIQTQQDIQYIAKDRSKKLNPLEEPNLTNIFNKIRGE